MKLKLNLFNAMLITVVFLAILTVTVSSLQAASVREEKVYVPLAELPANIKKAIEQAFPNGEITKIEKEVEGEDPGGGPIWRAKDADNYYVSRWNPLENNFRVYYVKDGRRVQLATADIKTDPGKWHEIEIEHVGNNIVAEFDDEKVIEIEDSTFSQGGMVGLWTKADASTAFDDFEVETEADDND